MSDQLFRYHSQHLIGEHFRQHGEHCVRPNGKMLLELFGAMQKRRGVGLSIEMDMAFAH